MIVQTLNANPKSNSLSHSPSPNCALSNLAGFADKTVFVDSAQSQTRDAFGSPYLGNLENDIGFGYCGKVYDVGTGLYDYGFRDYNPVSPRFTTIDPIRDGANWFSYVVNDPVNYVDPFGLESNLKENLQENFNEIKGNFENLFSGEIINNTTYNLFPRADNNEINNDLLKIKEEFKIEPGTTLTAALSKNDILPNEIALDSLVLPDGSIYKGWAGSKITVTETKNFDGTTSFNVKQSIGTQIINGIINVGRSILNVFRNEGNKKEYNKYYDASTVDAMEAEQKEKTGELNPNSITKYREDKNLPTGYINRNLNNKSQTTQQGCTK